MGSEMLDAHDAHVSKAVWFGLFMGREFLFPVYLHLVVRRLAAGVVGDLGSFRQVWH